MSISSSPTKEKAGLPRFITGGDGKEPVSYPAKRGEREPLHPGAIINSSRLALAGRPSLRTMGEAIGVSHTHLDRIEKGDAQVTAEHDVLICHYFGMKTDGIFLRMQHAYDMWHARKKLAEQLEKIVPAERA